MKRTANQLDNEMEIPQRSLKFRGKSQMRFGLCLLRPKSPAYTAPTMLWCGKMTGLDRLSASGRRVGALLPTRELRRNQIRVQRGRQVQQRQDAHLQRRQRRQMPDLLSG